MKRPAEEPHPEADPPPVWSALALHLLGLLAEPDDEHAGRVIPFRRPEDEPR